MDLTDPASDFFVAPYVYLFCWHVTFDFVDSGTPAKNIKWTRRVGLNSKSSSYGWAWRAFDADSKAVSDAKGSADVIHDEPIPARPPSPSKDIVARARIEFAQFAKSSTVSTVAVISKDCTESSVETSVHAECTTVSYEMEAFTAEAEGDDITATVKRRRSRQSTRLVRTKTSP